MAQTPLELKLIEALEQRAEEQGIDIVDVEVVGSSKAPVVRVRIDHADESLPTISLDEVSAQSAWINEVLDEADPFPGTYSLEVSSPGLARPLRRERDFVRFVGETISLSTKVQEGRRKYTGKLLSCTDGNITVSCDEGEFTIDINDIKSAKIKPDYDELARAARSGQE